MTVRRPIEIDESLTDRFWSRLNVGALDECWEWQGARNDKGYGVISTRGKTVSTHRVSYRIHKGEIPDTLVIDHICRNPPCANPSHIRAVTQQIDCIENSVSVAAINAAKTHCANGHDYVMTSKGRVCPECTWQQSEEYKDRMGRKKAFGRRRPDVYSCGHPRTPENSYKRGLYKICKICRNEWQAANDAKRGVLRKPRITDK